VCVGPRIRTCRQRAVVGFVLCRLHFFLSTNLSKTARVQEIRTSILVGSARVGVGPIGSRRVVQE
jgi:hypothetical protein